MKTALSYHLPILLLIAVFSVPAMGQVEVPVLDRRAEWESGEMVVTPQKEEAVMALPTDSITISGKVRFKRQVGVTAPRVIVSGIKGDFYEMVMLASDGFYTKTIAIKDIEEEELQVSIGGRVYDFKHYEHVPIKDGVYNATLKIYKPSANSAKVHICPAF